MAFLKTSLLHSSWSSHTLIVLCFDCRHHCFVHTALVCGSPPYCTEIADKLEFRKTGAFKQTQISSIFLVKEKLIRCNFFLWGWFLQTLQLSLWKNKWKLLAGAYIFCCFYIYEQKHILYSAYIDFANKICWCLQNYGTVVQMPATCYS